MEVINLNLIPTGALPVVHASQYDEGRRFRANLMDGSTVYTLDGTETLECDVKKPDGNIVTVAVTNTSDSYVEIDTTLQMCACAGDSLAELHITKGAQEIGTLNFILAVERSPLEGGIESESEINNLATQVAGLVASEVEDQYDSANVIFDNEPTEGHGNGYTVTSEGIGNAIDNALDMTDTASGAIATFESEYALPLRNLEIEINAVQSGSGTSSPDNVRPITGFTGANIHVADNETPHIIDNVTAISWQSEAGTVYGGLLDVTSGVLTITHGFKTYTGASDEDWRLHGAIASLFYIDNSLNNAYLNNAELNYAITNMFVQKGYNRITSLANGEFCLGDTNGRQRLAFKYTDVATVADWKTWLSSNNLTIAFKLATPVTYQLTPTQISAIVGTNNVFTDTNGDTSLEYYTKRGEQTVHIAEGVAVDVINNKNIDTLNTTNKTLVGAVNEVNNRLKQTKTLIIDKETISTGSTHTIANYSNYDALFFKINTDDNNGIVFTIPKIMYGESMPFSLYSRNAGDFDASSYYIRAHGNVRNGTVSLTYVKVVGWSASSAKLNVWGINFGIGT